MLNMYTCSHAIVSCLLNCQLCSNNLVLIWGKYANNNIRRSTFLHEQQQEQQLRQRKRGSQCDLRLRHLYQSGGWALSWHYSNMWQTTWCTEEPSYDSSVDNSIAVQIGLMSHRCGKYGALKWQKETERMCCLSGNVSLPHSLPLQSLLKYSESCHFLITYANATAVYKMTQFWSW
jgi:hypothetical protein